MQNNTLFAVVDIETTGYNNSCNNITEIAIVLYDGKKVVNSFHSLVNPQTPINPYVAGLTGISNEMLMDAPTFSEIATQVKRFTKSYPKKQECIIFITRLERLFMLVRLSISSKEYTHTSHRTKNTHF